MAGAIRRNTSLLDELVRRWPPVPVVWQAQYTEPPGRAAARLAACACRVAGTSTQSPMEELVRAWPPLARGWLSCGRRSTRRWYARGCSTIWAHCICCIRVAVIGGKGLAWPQAAAHQKSTVTYFLCPSPFPFGVYPT